MNVEQKSLRQEHVRTSRFERQRLKRLWWAGVLIWAGIVFGADSLGMLPRFGVGDAWSWTFAGAGLLGILGSIYRMTSADVPNPTAWDWVWGGICLTIGLGGFTSPNLTWPLILILVGIVSLASLLWLRDQSN